MGDRFVISFAAGAEYSEDRDGVNWFDAPLPRRWHRCRAQSRGNLGGHVYRCACGAISPDGKYWLERNSRRAARIAESKGDET